MTQPSEGTLVRFPVAGGALEGNLAIPAGTTGVVIFAHGSGSSRHSPRNRAVAAALREGGLGTLLLDLLTAGEEEIDDRGGRIRFEIDLLADRLVGATDWLLEEPSARGLSIGYFGASTGAGAALLAAAQRPNAVRAVVSRGGRPDLAGPALPRVRAATLLIVGSNDPVVLELNQQAFDRLRCEKRLEVVPGATHLFEEPGALESVAALARGWFRAHLTGGGAEAVRGKRPEASP